MQIFLAAQRGVAICSLAKIRYVHTTYNETTICSYLQIVQLSTTDAAICNLHSHLLAAICH